MAGNESLLLSAFVHFPALPCLICNILGIYNDILCLFKGLGSWAEKFNLEISSLSSIAQETLVKSEVYKWNELKVEKEASRERRPILKGSTTDLEVLEIHVG